MFFEQEYLSLLQRFLSARLSKIEFDEKLVEILHPDTSAFPFCISLSSFFLFKVATLFPIHVLVVLS